MRTLGLLLLISGAASAQGAPDTPDAETLEDTAEALRQRAEALRRSLEDVRAPGLRRGGRCDQGVPMPSLGLEGGPAPVPMPEAELEGRMAPMPNLCDGPGPLAELRGRVVPIPPALREDLDRLRDRGSDSLRFYNPPRVEPLWPIPEDLGRGLDPLRDRLDRLPPPYRSAPDSLRLRFDAPGPGSLERRPRLRIRTPAPRPGELDGQQPAVDPAGERP